MKKVFDDFTKCYPISKTLQFSLIPKGKTLEHIKASGIIDEDAEKFEKYKAVKPLFDQCHREYIEQCMSGVEMNWEDLADSLCDYQEKSQMIPKKA